MPGRLMIMFLSLSLENKIPGKMGRKNKVEMGAVVRLYSLAVIACHPLRAIRDKNLSLK